MSAGAIGAATAAEIGTGIVAGGLIGGGVGAVGSAIEGRPILTGALEGAGAGALTGGFAGGGAALGAEAGIGATAGGAIGGAAGGALGSQVTGGSPVIGAAGGALAGGIAGSSSGAPGDVADAGAGSGAGAGGSVGAPSGGAAAIEAPTSITADTGTIGQAMGGPQATGVSMAENPLPASGGDPGASLPGPGSNDTITGPSDQVAPNVQEITGLGAQVTPATASTANAVANPELGGSTGFSPGGAAESAPEGGFLSAFGDTQTGTDANAALGIKTGTGAGGAGTGAAAKTTNWGNFSNAPFGTVGDALSNNSWLAPVGSLGLAAGKSLMSTAPNSTALSKDLQSQANTLQGNSAQMEAYLATGTLPAGVQNSISSASQSAKASIRSQYASRGMSGSSSEAADLAAVDQHASSQGATIALQLLNTGVSEAGLADQIYGQLLQGAIAQDNQLSTAVSSFASSMVPRAGTNVTINQPAAAA